MEILDSDINLNSRNINYENILKTIELSNIKNNERIFNSNKNNTSVMNFKKNPRNIEKHVVSLINSELVEKNSSKQDIKFNRIKKPHNGQISFKMLNEKIKNSELRKNNAKAGLKIIGEFIQETNPKFLEKNLNNDYEKNKIDIKESFNNEN